MTSALLKLPSTSAWLDFARTMLWLVPALAICVYASTLMSFQLSFDDATLRLALVAFFIPALGEELFFRAAMMPRPDKAMEFPRRAAITSTILFTLWHPLQALILEGLRRAIFLDPWFLVASAALGAACSWLYWRSGSIWPSVILHWLAVIGWKALAGGPPLI